MNIGMIPAKWARQTPNAEAIVDSTTGKRINSVSSRVTELAC